MPPLYTIRRLIVNVIYWLDVTGRVGWLARYVKIVDANEKTLSFSQEIYDEQGKLVEIHEKFPVDKGHQKVKGDTQ